MEQYTDYMFAAFDKLNFAPFDLFLDFCEKNMDDFICGLIEVTLGDSLIYTNTDQIYIDYIEKNAGPETKKCLGPPIKTTS